jgi:uncharacterized DUF497 family protein
MAIKFEWDPKKAADNLSKHGESFETARLAWRDALSVVTIDDREDYGEERLTRVSMVGNRILTISYTERSDGGNEIIRIISLRKATKRERKEYEEG